MGLLYCQEERIMVEKPGQDDEKSIGLGEGEPYQTMYDKLGELYRAAQKEHGRCIGYVMVDEGGKSHPVGWVFRRRLTSSEANGDRTPTLVETVVTVYTQPPNRVWVPGIYAKVGG